MRFLYILRESLLSALKTISANKLRTILSLLGVTIGIFAIISVFTVIDSMEKEVKKVLADLGDDVIYIEKWPWAPEEGEEYPWWKYLNRPVPTLKEYFEVKRRVTSAKAVSFLAITQKNVEYKNNLAEDIQIWGVSEEFDYNRSLNIEKGRFLTAYEINTGKNLAIIGNEVASRLFEDEGPVGKRMKVMGNKTIILGVLAREGKSLLGGGSMDKAVLLPVKFLGTMVDLRREQNNPMIWVSAADNVSVPELKEELRGVMRGIRRLKPSAEDNFALNQTSMLTGGINQIFNVINIAGAIIGIFSILVGGFGIANIMFVSVKERTHIIGIKKALGAKKHYIMLEVLYESGILSLIGGIFGLILIYIGTLIVGRVTEFNISLSIGNIVTGLVISSVVGLVSGLAPAISAAKLNPVEAIAVTF
jgi:putative ABC transport system permease protein